MSDHAVPKDSTAGAEHGHDDPMSHVPPGSIWPLVVTLGLLILPFSVLILLGNMHFTLGNILPNSASTWTVPQGWGLPLVIVAGLIVLYSLMGWANQIIKEKAISHDLGQQQTDLKQFIGMFLLGELSVFGAIFGYFYHRKLNGTDFGPIHGMHLGGWQIAIATFILITSSATAEVAHRGIEHGHRLLGKVMLIVTILLGIAFLAFQAFEYGELFSRGYSPAALGSSSDPSSASFASVFFAGTGFHGLHVAIGLVMLFMVLLRLEFGHFRGSRHFSMIAASWYWHFVDIVWIILFISFYVVA